MNVVNSRANLVGVTVLLECMQELHVALGRLDGDDISVKALNRGEDIVEVRVTEVGVSLESVGNACGGELERVDSPGEVGIPVNAAKRKLKGIASANELVVKSGRTYTLADGRLVDLDGVDTGLLKVTDLVAESKRELLGLQFTRNIGTRERPVQDGDGTSKHALHGFLGDALGVRAPLHGHRSRATDV